jgi:hypothetical protein
MGEKHAHVREQTDSTIAHACAAVRGWAAQTAAAGGRRAWRESFWLDTLFQNCRAVAEEKLLGVPHVILVRVHFLQLP